MTQAPPQQPFQETLYTTVTALGRDKKGDGWAITVDHSWQGSQYPTIFYTKVAEDAAGLAVGALVTIVAQKSNLKPGKDPSKPYNYYWDMAGIVKGHAGRPAPTLAQSVPVDQEAGPPDPRSTTEDKYGMAEQVKRRSIERQKSLELAIDYGAKVLPSSPLASGGSMPIGWVLETAEQFYVWISGQTVTAQQVKESPTPTAQPQTPRPAAIAPAQPATLTLEQREKLVAWGYSSASLPWPVLAAHLKTILGDKAPEIRTWVDWLQGGRTIDGAMQALEQAGQKVAP